MLKTEVSIDLPVCKTQRQGSTCGPRVTSGPLMFAKLEWSNESYV